MDYSKEAQLKKNVDEKQKEVRYRKCRYCKEKTVPYGSINPFCFENKCIIKHNEVTTASKKRKAKQELRNNNKSELMEDCQKLAQKIGRQHGRLSGLINCVTCSTPLATQIKHDGGHFLPKNNYSEIKLYTLQIHPQCVKCNQHNSGMRHEYKLFMISRYGEEKTEWLESFKGVISKKYTLEYLRKYKNIMGKRSRVLQKRIDNLL